MIRFRAALALLLAAWVSGCGRWNMTPHVSLNGEEAARLSAGKLWVVAHFPFKQFIYKESLLRPWGWNNAANTYSLHGIWDPTPALEEAVVTAFKKRYGVTAVPFRSLVEPEVFEKLAKETEARFLELGNAERMVSWLERQMDPLAAESSRRGGEYLLEVWVRLEVFRYQGGAANFLFWSWNRVIRLDTLEVVWCRTGLCGTAEVSVEDFKDYAANDLALFKEAFAKSAADMCTRWGAFNPFADLLPKRTD